VIKHAEIVKCALVGVNQSYNIIMHGMKNMSDMELL
jgi:hypothetical protein